jgi:hypothetical protein
LMLNAIDLLLHFYLLPLYLGHRNRMKRLGTRPKPFRQWRLDR